MKTRHRFRVHEEFARFRVGSKTLPVAIIERNAVLRFERGERIANHAQRCIAEYIDFHQTQNVFGLIFLGVVWNNARKGIYTAEQHWGVEAAAVYWHFVDLVWIFFYPALYLIGTAVQ